MTAFAARLDGLEIVWFTATVFAAGWFAGRIRRKPTV